ncbi:hypothetical protein Y032_0005g2705 [Ancylostoma ceylanicum]|uniref:Uncharacterized protein n=1 Tax=Ancylostoma ceylanicum TaxID=53326 RepID=A0A016VT44_9BILA|nr:hypothetical protein Y032_0005g2705 [Ancylostoma ceylanicum]
MRELDELDVLDVEMTDDADSDEEAMGEKCITLLSSLLPSGSCLYPLSEPVAYKLTSSPQPPEDEERPAPTFAILSSAAEVEANCAANSDVDADDELTVEVLPAPEEHLGAELDAAEEGAEVRFFWISHSIWCVDK